MRLKDRVAVITGAAQGIGLACAERFQAEGAKLMLSDINETGGQAAAARLGAPFIRADAGLKPDVEALIRRAVEIHGRVDIMLANAGIIARLNNEVSEAQVLFGEARVLLEGDRASRAELGHVDAEIARLKAERGDPDAEAALTAALATLAAVEEVETPESADARVALGRLQLRAGRAADALPMLERADDFWRSFAADGQSAADAARALADCRSRTTPTGDAQAAGGVTAASTPGTGRRE